MLSIMQGDQYNVPILIKAYDGTAINIDIVSDVEVMIGKLRKRYPGEITYSTERNRWIFPLTQDESFALATSRQPVQVRIKFNNGDVVGVNVGEIKIGYSRSREVL